MTEVINFKIRLFWAIENRSQSDLAKVLDEIIQKDIHIDLYFIDSSWMNHFTETQVRNFRIRFNQIMDFGPIQHACHTFWPEGAKMLIHKQIGLIQGSGLPTVDISRVSLFPTYAEWLNNHNKAIVRTHHPIQSSSCKYTYRLCDEFDILSKIIITFDEAIHFDEILEARLQIGSCLTSFKLEKERFKRLSDFSYELEFAVEKYTRKQLLIPLIAISHHRYLQIFLFVKNMLNVSPQIICEYYNLNNSFVRNALTRNMHCIELEDGGEIHIMGGTIGLKQTKWIPSIWQNNYYNIISDQLSQTYYQQKIINGRNFELAINYQDFDIDQEILDKIIHGLSIEWNIYCQKNTETEGYLLYF